MIVGQPELLVLLMLPNATPAQVQCVFVTQTGRSHMSDGQKGGSAPSG